MRVFPGVLPPTLRTKAAGASSSQGVAKKEPVFEIRSIFLNEKALKLMHVRALWHQAKY